MTDPQPVPDAYRCGDLDPTEWEVWDRTQMWVPPSKFVDDTIRPARRKQAPPLTPREGDLVVTTSGYEGQVVAVHNGHVCVQGADDLRVAWSDLVTVTDRPPKRPVRVWLTDEQVRSYARVTRGCYTPVGDACRAMVDGEG